MARRTPLYDWHRRQGAKFVDFGGWDMPVQYTSIVQEHRAVRSRAGIFDVSHMGEIFVEGEAALPFLQKICTNDVAKCAQGRALYSHLCNEQGGILDDIFVYCLTFPSRYLVVVNASTSEKDAAWMAANQVPGARLRNASDDFGMLAVQGPLAEQALSGLFPALPGRHAVFEQGGRYVCRTGYTGEDGFEVIAPAREIEALADRVLQSGRGLGLVPCGLGARDTLRMEAGYLLYGSDADEQTTPLEAGVPWAVKFDKPDFIGKGALLRQKQAGLKKTLAAFKLKERGVPRHGSAILCGGRRAGAVTSGTFSPSLQIGIAMGYVPPGASGDFAIECHGRPVPAEKTGLPFYSGSKK